MKMKTCQTIAPRESSVRPRQSRIPRNVGRACKQIRTFSKEIANRLDGWNRSLFNWVMEAPSEELTDDLLTELRQTQHDIVAMGKACEEVGDKLTQASSRVKRVLAIREMRKHEPAGTKRKGVHEEEDVENEWSDEVEGDEETESDDEDEVESDDESELDFEDEIELEVESEVKKAHDRNGGRLSVQEKIARARAKGSW